MKKRYNEFHDAEIMDFKINFWHPTDINITLGLTQWNDVPDYVLLVCKNFKKIDMAWLYESQSSGLYTLYTRQIEGGYLVNLKINTWDDLKIECEDYFLLDLNSNKPREFKVSIVDDDNEELS